MVAILIGSGHLFTLSVSSPIVYESAQHTCRWFANVLLESLGSIF